MNSQQQRKLKQAIKHGWFDAVAEIGKDLSSARDRQELQAMIRKDALPFEYTEIGSTMYYDGDVEIGPYQVSGTGIL